MAPPYGNTPAANAIDSSKVRVMAAPNASKPRRRSSESVNTVSRIGMSKRLLYFLRYKIASCGGPSLQASPRTSRTSRDNIARATAFTRITAYFSSQRPLISQHASRSARSTLSAAVEMGSVNPIAIARQRAAFAAAPEMPLDASPGAAWTSLIGNSPVGNRSASSGGVLRDEPRQTDPHRLGGRHLRSRQPIEHERQQIRLRRPGSRDAQLGMRGGQRALVVRQHLLIQFLAAAQPREHDANVAFREAGQSNHLARQIDDAHRLSHVEHENLPSGSHGSGLQHELGRFGDRHEVTRDLGMRNRHRATLRDLLAELRDYTSRAAQHVAEAHDHEARAVRLLQPQAYELRQALAGPHYIHRVHRLVGGNQDERLHPMTRRCGGDGISAQHVVLHCLPGVVLFHQRHMLVGGGMEQ